MIRIPGFPVKTMPGFCTSLLAAAIMTGCQATRRAPGLRLPAVTCGHPCLLPVGPPGTMAAPALAQAVVDRFLPARRAYGGG